MFHSLDQHKDNLMICISLLENLKEQPLMDISVDQSKVAKIDIKKFVINRHGRFFSNALEVEILY